MPKSEDTLAVLRSELEVAQAAQAALPEDADNEVRAAASEAIARAETALRDAHLKEQQAEERKQIELREAEEAAARVAAAEAEEVPEPMSLLKLIQAGTVQNVRGTDALTPEEHAARRNPTR